MENCFWKLIAAYQNSSSFCASPPSVGPAGWCGDSASVTCGRPRYCLLWESLNLSTNASDGCVMAVWRSVGTSELEESELPNTRTARSTRHLRSSNEKTCGLNAKKSLLDFLFGRDSRLVESSSVFFPTQKQHPRHAQHPQRRVTLRLTGPHPLVMSQLPLLSPEESSESA